MWQRSFIGGLLGLFLSMSLMLNLHGILPVAVDKKLLIGLISGFVIWAFAMVYCYYCRSLTKATVVCLSLLSVSIALHFVLRMSGS